jgi:hypothetical protein
VFAFIVDHKLSAAKVVLGLMRGVWIKVLGFRIIISQKYIIFMHFFGFLLVRPVTLKKPMKGFDLIFLSNHQTGLIFKTMPDRSGHAGSKLKYFRPADSALHNAISDHRPTNGRDIRLKSKANPKLNIESALED